MQRGVLFTLMFIILLSTLTTAGVCRDFCSGDDPFYEIQSGIQDAYDVSHYTPGEIELTPAVGMASIYYENDRCVDEDTLIERRCGIWSTFFCPQTRVRLLEADAVHCPNGCMENEEGWGFCLTAEQVLDLCVDTDPEQDPLAYGEVSYPKGRFTKIIAFPH